MKINFNTSVIVIIVFMVVINIAIFIRGISLSNDIQYFEEEMAQLKDQNTSLQQKIYKASSYEQTASIAAELNYGKYNDPLYDSLSKYALK